MPDARTLFDALIAVAGFMAAFWIRAIREDFREMVKQVANHGERIAVLESKVERLDRRSDASE